MAGSGEYTRVGNKRGLNANLNSAITNGVVNPPGDLIGTITTAISAGATAQTTLTLSGGITKAIPDDCVVVACSATGGVDTMEAFTVNGAAASGATTVTIDSCTVNKARANGDQLFLLAFKAFLALMTTQTTPADNTLGTEVAFTGYARQVLAQTSPTDADPPVVANSGSITWGPMSGADGTKTVRYMTEMDCLSGGTIANAYSWWDVGVGATRTPNAGDSVNVAAAALTMQSFH